MRAVVRFVSMPLSSVLSPLLRRGARKKKRATHNLGKKDNTLMDSNPARAERLVQRQMKLQKYDVAPREGVLRVRRKILRQLLKRKISKQAIPR
jgi:hypothetical protein